MTALYKPLLPCLLLLLLTLPATTSAESAARELMWVDLLPAEDLRALLAMPEADHSGGGDDGSPVPLRDNRQYADAPAGSFEAALSSTRIRPELDGQEVRLAGFVVPLEYSAEQRVTHFFLVPYFGACLHLPPPPPNQIVHVHYAAGLELHSLYEPFFVDGELGTTLVENGIASAAYTLRAAAITPYFDDFSEE